RQKWDRPRVSPAQKMAALGSSSTSEKAGIAAEAQSGPDNDFWAGQGPVVLRDPAIKWLNLVSGLEPLSWAEDHRLAASSTNSVSIMELVCDIHSLSQNLVLHHSHIACDLKVGPEKEVQTVKESFAKSKDPVASQMILVDRVIHPQSGCLRGIKYTSWSPLGYLDELQQWFRMQTPVRMEWSGLCSMQQVQTNNACKDVSTVLLAVLMENGDVVVWQFSLPPQGKDSVISCNTIKSGVLSPSVLTWWEYEHSGRKMSGLIVGSSVGPVKILPVNLKDLVVAACGPYVFWCLLLITKAGFNVHNSHVTGLHSTPIISMTVCHNGGTILTCSLDGKVKKLTPVFTDAAVEFKQEEIVLPEGVAGRRMQGTSISPNGAYLALISNEGMINGLHPINRTYQVQFITLKTPDEAAAELLESQMHSLFRKADLLDLLRWRILKDKSIPSVLQNNLDEKIQTSGSTYLWRLKLFLLRTLYKSMQKSPSEHLWRPTHREGKVLVEDEEAGGGEDEMAEISTLEELREVSYRIEKVESQLSRENMKKVLGEVYLHTCVTQNTCIPTKGVCDFLTNDPANEDRAAKVLIGHIMNKMNKQTFPEYCILCKEVLPFTDCKRAECKNGHRWLRCALSYQACQGVTYRRCLLQDSVASVAEPEGEKYSQGPCIFCDSPFY
uniref:Ral transcription factor IIIC subunit 4 n=1 Tax=Sinocyclocheilus grahami TaxID=75366 RepID=A0A672SKW8_SINGR